MKKIFLAIGMIFLSTVMFAQQRVAHYEYRCTDERGNLTAPKVKDDLEALIAKGYKIISFCYRRNSMIVVYDDLK